MRPALLLVLLTSPTLAAQGFDFYDRGPYRPAVPRPEAILGFAPGEQHTMYAQLQRYLDTLVASAPERVRIERWGQTAERRPIRALIISDPANLARLNAIFPSGVCDWSQPSVGQVPATAMQWSTYTGGPGFVPLGSPPVSR